MSLSKSQSRATYILNRELERGSIVRPRVCQLCDYSALRWNIYAVIDVLRGRTPPDNIVGHHWRGYDHPLDVWWICYGCNRILAGEHYHNGGVSLEQAKSVVRPTRRKSLTKLEDTWAGVLDVLGEDERRRIGEFVSMERGG